MGAQLGAPVMVGLSVLGVIRTSQSASLYFRSGGSRCVDRSWAGHALLFVCLYVSFGLGVLTGVGLVMHCFLFVFTCPFMCFVSV